MVYIYLELIIKDRKVMDLAEYAQNSPRSTLPQNKPQYKKRRNSAINHLVQQKLTMVMIISE